MTDNRKQLLDTFQQCLYDNYKDYCQRHELIQTSEGLIVFLIDQDLIPPKNIKGYAVINEFEKIKEQKEGKKTRLVELLSDRFNLSERSVWGILKDNSMKS